ncbi:hypothetical protein YASMINEVIRUS_197 [Yasminevirus sp. GU-2018]|uniref:C2H2-type domain-containing protein n=1 Tax=Yasminevirus sp. GU-2018 TaxID=2420051 RepID=A0A5K0U8B1_9VIRU|nr:hypothetical protein YASMINEVIRUS_197 [Yasminevirus sp. GU-2018]
MTSYKCEACKKVFKRQSNLEYHVTNKVCVGRIIEEDSSDDTKSHKCKFCNKKFTTATSMYRHINHTCKIKKKDDDEREQIYERLLKFEESNNERMKKLEKENAQLKKEVTILKKNVKTSKVVNTVNNGNMNINKGVINNTTNQIILVGYGQEDLSKLDKSQLIKILQNGYNSTVKLTEAVHFNPKYPEYHNIYISNMRDKYAMMFDGNKWTLTMKEDLINQIYEDKKNYIEENLEIFLDSLTVSRKKALDRWLETDDEDEKISRIKSEIKLLLYNKRNLILDKDVDVKKPKKLIKNASKKTIKDESSDED